MQGAVLRPSGSARISTSGASAREASASARVVTMSRCPASPSKRSSVRASSVAGSPPKARTGLRPAPGPLGQKRVPSPPAITTRWRSPAISGPRTAVAVREPDDVVELRSGHLENVAVLQGDHPMLPPDRDVVRLTLPEKDLLELALLVLEHESHLAVRDEDRFLLHAMVLEREPVARLDVQYLADVVGGLRPDELVAPGFLDALDRLFRHDETYLRTNSASSSKRAVGFRSGRPHAACSRMGSSGALPVPDELATTVAKRRTTTPACSMVAPSLRPCSPDGAACRVSRAHIDDAHLLALAVAEGTAALRG